MEFLEYLEMATLSEELDDMLMVEKIDNNIRLMIESFDNDRSDKNEQLNMVESSNGDSIKKDNFIVRFIKAILRKIKALFNMVFRRKSDKVKVDDSKINTYLNGKTLTFGTGGFAFLYFLTNKFKDSNGPVGKEVLNINKKIESLRLKSKELNDLAVKYNNDVPRIRAKYRECVSLSKEINGGLRQVSISGDGQSHVMFKAVTGIDLGSGEYTEKEFEKLNRRINKNISFTEKDIERHLRNTEKSLTYIESESKKYNNKEAFNNAIKVMNTLISYDNAQLKMLLLLKQK